MKLAAKMVLTFVVAMVVATACCSAHYRRFDGRYYKAIECPWGDHVECDSATRLPDPATWTEGCR